MRRMKTALLPLALLLPIAALAADDDTSKPQWGKTEQSAAKLRTQVDGMNTYYDPEALKKDGDVYFVRVYNSYDPQVKETGTDYAINCATQEIATASGGQWGKPQRILGGEAMYAFGKKLCDWGPGWFSKAIKAVTD